MRTCVMGGQGYGDVALASAVDGASPHRLVAILYDELLSALDTLRLASSRGATAQAARARTRAATIIAGLDAGLDPQAGEVATTLRRLYRGALTIVGDRSPAPESVDALRTTFADIAQSWAAIAERG